jgi:DNA replication protein
MSQFSGFPVRMEFTPVPNIFISNVLSQITDIAELKVTLHIFRLLGYKKVNPRFLTYRELAEDAGLMNSLSQTGKQPDEVLRQALKSASLRGVILHLIPEGTTEGVYFLNTEANREAIAKIQSGELKLDGLEAKRASLEVITAAQPNIFALYEENIGLLTPMIAEQLKDAEKIYPEAWIKDAVKEAVNAGKRNWRYISAILERWTTEGRSDGTHLRNFKKTDPDKFIKGKYGHIFKR